MMRADISVRHSQPGDTIERDNSDSGPETDREADNEAKAVASAAPAAAATAGAAERPDGADRLLDQPCAHYVAGFIK